MDSTGQKASETDLAKVWIQYNQCRQINGNNPTFLG